MIILLISITAIGLTVLLYYKNLSLAPLRIVAIIILYILITGFSLSVALKKEQKPPVVLIDYSASMTNYFPAVLQKIENLDFPHTLFYFSESLYTTGAKTNVPSGRFTNITGAILTANKESPSAILLISDGNHNYGHSPLSIIDDLNTPVYSFGVGTEAERDLAIADIICPNYAFTGASINIEIIAQSRGFESGRGEIQLKSVSKNIKLIESFPLSDVKAKSNIEFRILATQSDEMKFTARLMPQPGEITYENNELEFSIKILEKKIKVIYYTDHPSFNTRFILPALKKDNYVELRPVVKTGIDKYWDPASEQHVTTLPELHKFDVLILDNIDFDRLPWHNIKKLSAQGLGILCLGRIQGNTQLLRDILPISVVNLPIKGNHQIKIVEPFSCLSLNDEYPPITYINRVLGVKEDAVIIAETNHMPIIAYRGHSQGMVFQINSLDIGTWQFLQLGLTQKDLLSCLLADIVRFISPIGKNRRLVLKSLHNDYSIGEALELTLQSFDRNFKPAGQGDFYTEFNRKKIPFFEISKGVYKTSFIAEKSGEYQLKAFGKFDEENLTSNELKIKVLTRPIEIEQGINPEFLQTLSARTGGKYHSIDELHTFKIPEPKKSKIMKTINFDIPLIYVLIVSLLAIDWFIRRKRGTI